MRLAALTRKVPTERIGNARLLIDGVSHKLTESLIEVDNQVWVAVVDARLVVTPVLEALQNRAKSIKTVILDPGHGGADVGTIGLFGLEKMHALDLAERVASALVEHGIPVVHTRDGDAFVPQFKRAAVANATPDGVFVSLHFNSGGRDSSGIETFVTSKPVGTIDTDRQSQSILLARAPRRSRQAFWLPGPRNRTREMASPNRHSSPRRPARMRIPHP